MVKLLITLVLLAIVIFFTLKKFHPGAVLLLSGSIALIIWQMVTGQSVLGESTTSSVLIDTLEFINTTAATSLGNTLLVPLLLFGYLAFMDHMGATQAFSYVLGRPLRVIKNEYLLATIIIPIAVLMKCVITNGMSIIVMLLGTIYPILRSRGCTKATCAGALGVMSCVCWGPGEMSTILCTGLSGVGVDSATFFIQHQFVSTMLVTAAMSVVFFITAPIFDRAEKAKEKEAGDAEEQNVSADEKPAAPLAFAILPILPLVVMIVFSSLVLKDLAMTPAAAIFACFFVAFVINLFYTRKDLKAAIGSINAFAQGCADCLQKSFVMMLGGQILATSLQKIGGFDFLIDALINAGGSVTMMTILGALLAITFVTMTAGFMAGQNIFIPFFNTIANATGASVGPLVQVAQQATGMGMSLSPASSPMLLVCSTLGINIMTAIKRSALPILCGLAVLVMHGLIVC